MAGARIRELRSARGLSLSALASAAGLGKGTLSELERGRRNPTLDTLFAVATVLAVPLSDLLAGPLSGLAAGAGTAPAEAGRPRRPAARGHSVEAQLIDRWGDDLGFTEVYRLRISGRRQRSQPHGPGVRETLTVIGGVAETGLVSAPVLLRAAETHTFPGDAEHLYRGAGGPATAILTMYYPAPSIPAPCRRNANSDPGMPPSP